MYALEHISLVAANHMVFGNFSTCVILAPTDSASQTELAFFFFFLPLDYVVY